MTTSDARKRIRENAAQAATTPAPVPWVVQIESCHEHGEDDVMHPEPPDIVWAQHEDDAVSLAGEDRDYDTNLLSVRRAGPSDFPTPAPVAVPEGGWRDGDAVRLARGRRPSFWLHRDSIGEWYGIDGFVHADDDMVAHAIAADESAYSRILAVHAPREDAPRPEPVTAPSSTMTLAADDWLAVVLIDDDGVAHLRDSGAIDPEVLGAALRELADRVAPDEPVTAPLPSEAMELLPAVERFPNPKSDVDRLAILLMTTWERVEGPVGTSYVADFADMARDALAAGYTLPAADQRARDEGTVREEIEAYLSTVRGLNEMTVVRGLRKVLNGEHTTHLHEIRLDVWGEWCGHEGTPSHYPKGYGQCPKCAPDKDGTR